MRLKPVERNIQRYTRGTGELTEQSTTTRAFGFRESMKPYSTDAMRDTVIAMARQDSETFARDMLVALRNHEDIVPNPKAGEMLRSYLSEDRDGIVKHGGATLPEVRQFHSLATSIRFTDRLTTPGAETHIQQALLTPALAARLAKHFERSEIMTERGGRKLTVRDVIIANPQQFGEAMRRAFRELDPVAHHMLRHYQSAANAVADSTP
ncbi:MAG: hypothetical protein V1708_01850 [Candidatus Micrarchaeota archaeon]